MCEFSGKLVAWLDRELPPAEGAEVEAHLRHCAPCRNELAACEQASRAFDAYCDATAARSASPRLPRWAFPASGTAAAAIVAALLILLWNPHAQPAPSVPLPLSVAAVEPPVAQAAPSPHAAVARKIRRQPFALSVPAPVPAARPDVANWLPPQPVVEIAIPAQAMFAPGAVPEGVSFNADLTIGADGSVQWIRLRP